MKNVIESQQFDRGQIDQIFTTADHLSKSREPILKGKIMASLFYEPSTRTRFSFESAMYRLGGSVISTENAEEFSSAIKGETLEDSIKVISNYADVIVLRHSLSGASKQAAAVATVPVINAGDGAGQHPTQALLDLYTIKKELGRTEDMIVVMVGDLKNGRTVHSLAYLLGKYKGIKIIFVAPPELQIGEDIKAYLKRHNVSYEELEDLSSVVKAVDVLYQTRIQKERFVDPKEYQRFKGCYRLDKELVSTMKPEAIIMHPLPRVDEILTEVDEDPRAVYFRQTKYGMWVRMALLAELLME